MWPIHDGPKPARGRPARLPGAKAKRIAGLHVPMVEHARALRPGQWIRIPEAIGVAPSGLGPSMQIARRKLRECGRTDIDIYYDDQGAIVVHRLRQLRLPPLSHLDLTEGQAERIERARVTGEPA